VVHGTRSIGCPGVLDAESIVLSPQGFGPARNIVAFTGGDLTCCPKFYGKCAELVKTQTNLWFLIETNGYGLTSQNLDYLKASGVDAFWLDIKAYESKRHRWLTGCPGDRILKLPEEMIRRGFVLEVLSLFIPGLVEVDELEKIARNLQAVDSGIPFTILAFFPEHKMKHFRNPTVEEMVYAYEAVRSCGLTNVRLGNVGICARTEKDREYLAAHVDSSVY
jgi:pyruvate-formate lyase-activating enzyme